MPSFTSTTLEVSLGDPLHASRVVTEPVEDPGDGELVLQVERFGLSANNISYAQLGNRFGLGYWRPFPAADGWGRVPAWGVARVLAGDPALADVGERFVGLVPMADRMRVRATRTELGLADASSDREGMLPIYRTLRRVSTDDSWREDLLDVNLLLRPAYPPAALLADELGADGTAVLLTSATSKTALLTARLLTERGLRTTGLTSSRHLAAAVSTGAYAQVRPYDEVAGLPVEPTVLLDVAGASGTSEAVHAHLGPALSRHVLIGGTHHGDLAGVTGEGQPLSTAPEQFNTGAREVELTESRGAAAVLALEDAARDTLVPWAAGWFDLRTVVGPQALEREWHRLVRGPDGRSPLGGVTVIP